MGMAKDVAITDNLSLEQCFFCNAWTPPEYMHMLLLEGVEQKVCTACYRKLVNRLSKLKIEKQKMEEEQELEDDEETKAAFSGSQSEED
jgi:hypothetical protein